MRWIVNNLLPEKSLTNFKVVLLWYTWTLKIILVVNCNTQIFEKHSTAFVSFSLVPWSFVSWDSASLSPAYYRNLTRLTQVYPLCGFQLLSYIWRAASVFSKIVIVKISENQFSQLFQQIIYSLTIRQRRICSRHVGSLFKIDRGVFRTMLKIYDGVFFRSSHRRCSVKKAFFEISQNSQENTCAWDCFLIIFFNFI